MKAARDTQRLKLYRAEEKYRTANPEPEMPMADVVAFVERVVKSELFRDMTDSTWHQRSLLVTDGRARSSACASAWGVKLPRWARGKVVILHELAHAANDRNTDLRFAAAHGWEFADTFLRLVRRFIGVVAYEGLRAEFRVGKVKYKAPRKLTPEALERMRERGRALAAKRRPTP